MAWKTIVCGLLLVVIGVAGYALGTPNADTGEVSKTALIPAGIGGVLTLCGLLAFADGLRKHVMHLAAMVGLFGILGGFMPLIRQVSKGKDLDPTAPAALSGLAMTVVSAVFVGLCVKSFIDARKAREARQAAEAAGNATSPAS